MTTSITVDEVIDTTTDYAPGWTITDLDGGTAATIARVDEEEARVAVQTPDGDSLYIYVAENFSFVDRGRREVAARLPLGTNVQDDEDDPEPRVGVIVEPTAEDLAQGEDECCCFNPGSSYVLVEWSYPEGGVECEWESPDDLRVLTSNSAP